MKRMPISVSDVSRPLPPFDRPPEPAERSAKALRFKAAIAVFAAAVIAGCASSGGSLTPHKSSSGGLHQANNISRALPAVSPTPIPADQAGCGTTGGTQATCTVTKDGSTGGSSSPTHGLTPAQLRSAYGLPAYSGGTAAPTGPLVAVVAAFNDDKAESDLGTYRKQFGMAPCTSANHCFTRYTMKADPSAPPPSPAPKKGTPDATTWADEIALDLAMVSAACPNCRILLVQALGQDLDSLADAVNYAASQNPVAISNSWGVAEGGGNVPNIDADAQAAFNHPGIAITASAGDLGAGQVQFPASSPYVTAVGGTSLTADPTNPRGWTEKVWSGSGNGCSIMVGLPTWQTAAGGCAARSVPDVSMLADSSLGVTVFSAAENGWVTFGGTSVGAPFVAGLYAAANDYGAGTVGAPGIYANLGSLNPVSGTNGSPNGLAGF
jgi:subtilase family serine protease